MTKYHDGRVLGREEMAALAASMPDPDITGDEAMVVMKDISQGIKPRDSKLIYTAAMLRYRDAIERERAGQPAGLINTAPDL